MTDALNHPQEPEATSTSEQPERPNWSAADRFKDACSAADAVQTALHNHKEAVCEALRCTLCLIEDYRGDHKEEIATYLKGVKVKLGTDDVLPIVKHVFARQDRGQWNWHANALRQAIAEGKNSDDVAAYFKTTPPTQAAKKWSDAHRKPGTKAQRLEIALTNPPKKLDDFKDKLGSEKGLTVSLIQRDDKIVMLIAQPRKKAT